MKHDTGKTLHDSGKLVLLPLRKTLYCIILVNVFWLKKNAETFLKSLIKMPDITLSKEKVNLLTSDSVSSPHMNSKHLANITQQAIAGDQVVHRMANQNNALCQWATLKDSQNTLRHRYVAKRPMDLFPRVPRSDAILFAVQCNGVSHGEMCFLSANGGQDDNSHD